MMSVTSEGARQRPRSQAESEVDYRRLFESSPALLLLLGTDAEFTILGASDAYMHAACEKREAVIGRGLFHILPDDPGADGATGRGLRASLEKVLAKRSPDEMVAFGYDLFHGEGESSLARPFSLLNSPVLGADGALLFIVHRVEEVRGESALRQEGSSPSFEALRRELDEANAQLRAIYEQGLFAGRLRLDGSVIDVNRACLETCGFTSAQVLGKPFWECGWWRLSQDVMAWVKSAVQKAISGVPFRGVSRYFWADGSEHLVDFTCIPVKDASGRVELLVATGTDITERVKAENDRRALEEQRQRAEALAELDRASSTPFPTVSHEFRAPLTLIRGRLAGLARRRPGAHPCPARGPRRHAAE